MQDGQQCNTICIAMHLYLFFVDLGDLGMQIGMLDRAGTFTHRQLLLFIILDSGNLPLLLKCGSDPSHSSFIQSCNV
jgi:hypothetical protein